MKNPQQFTIEAKNAYRQQPNTVILGKGCKYFEKASSASRPLLCPLPLLRYTADRRQSCPVFPRQ